MRLNAFSLQSFKIQGIYVVLRFFSETVHFFHSPNDWSRFGVSGKIGYMACYVFLVFRMVAVIAKKLAPTGRVLIYICG